MSPNIFDIDIHAIPAYKGVSAHDHYDVRFLLQVKSDETLLFKIVNQKRCDGLA